MLSSKIKKRKEKKRKETTTTGRNICINYLDDNC